jgi:hypothetical protein
MHRLEQTLKHEQAPYPGKQNSQSTRKTSAVHMEESEAERPTNGNSMLWCILAVSIREKMSKDELITSVTYRVLPWRAMF